MSIFVENIIPLVRQRVMGADCRLLTTKPGGDINSGRNVCAVRCLSVRCAGVCEPYWLPKAYWKLLVVEGRWRAGRMAGEGRSNHSFGFYLENLEF